MTVQLPRLSWKYFVQSSALILLINASSYSAEPSHISTETLTLGDVLDAARHQNPEIKAARSRWEAVKTRAAQEATPDKPRVDFERMYAPEGRNVISGAEEKNIAISQEIMFPTTLYFRSRAARQEAEKAFAEYQVKEREIQARTKSAYAMLFFSRHSIHIFEANVDLMRQFAKVAESKYAVGKAPQSDVLKAQVELSKMLNMLVTVHQEQETNQAMLNTLMNRPPETPIVLPEDPQVRIINRSLSELTSQAAQQRPELRAAAADVERSRSLVQAARSEYLPDLMLQYRQRNMMAGPDSRDAMLGFSVPLWFWKQGAMVREAAAEREMAQAEYQAMRNMTSFDVKNLLVKVQTAQRLVELYQTSVLPQAEQALKVTASAYQSDRIGFLDLLDAARTLLDFRLEHYEHITQYEQFFAELERAVGADLKTEATR
ncbi:MAG: TolC family protein [Elusimicrobia bacterium]|jgi:cobalt-zinc-cadmium efflux system outer membrane protein|nr:TolC family protein [Elusimicrobiota bacterium]MBP9698405.1 TolC family protein [Elusimicrobiota bacterium]